MIPTLGNNSLEEVATTIQAGLIDTGIAAAEIEATSGRLDAGKTLAGMSIRISVQRSSLTTEEITITGDVGSMQERVTAVITANTEDPDLFMQEIFIPVRRIIEAPPLYFHHENTDFMWDITKGGDYGCSINMFRTIADNT